MSLSPSQVPTEIKLFCRVRPCTDLEKQSGLKVALTTANSSKIVSKFANFEHVFTPADDQDVVFSHLKPIATQAMMGHNVCLISYGQEASGKSFTMTALLCKVLEDLLRRSKNPASRKSLSISVLEVRQELIKDLLVSNSRRLQIKEGKVIGLTSSSIQQVEQLSNLLPKHRSDSSSHSLVRVTVRSLSSHATNHLWFVDMAGSQVDGSRGVCKDFNAVEDLLSCKIPSRNSQLTHLLHDCSKMGVIFNVSPTWHDFSDSLCTFSFARRLKMQQKKSPVQRYREWRQEMKSFSYDQNYKPAEPQDTLGFLYDGMLTALTQNMFRKVEYFSRRRTRLVNGCNAVASTVQSACADLAFFLIGEDSPYSKRKRYEGAGGLYAVSRFLIPAVATASVMLYKKHSEKEQKQFEEDKYQSIRDAMGKQELQNFKIGKRVGKIESSVGELEEAVKIIQIEMKKEKKK